MNKDNEEIEPEKIIQEEENIESSEIENAEGNEIDSLKAEVKESKDKYLRMYSEFENFRRRTAKERIELVGTATQKLMTELIPVLNDFQRAMTSMNETNDINAVKEGVTLIYQKFNKVLSDNGLKPMDLMNKEFDPDLAECITQIDAGPEKKGKVVDVVEQGYTLNDKVIRFAKVVVGS